MIKANSLKVGTLSLIVLFLSIASCKKGITDATTTTDISAAILSSQAIAVGEVGTNGDSIYLTQTCSRGGRRDALSLEALPAAVSAYVSATYAGATLSKAYSTKNGSGTLDGYVVVIQFNSNPVGLKFDTAGNFVQVLEQREGRDLVGNGWHHGGRFEHRNGRQKDTVALSQLPGAIVAYFAANYAQDTTVAAYKNRDSGYTVISKNGGLFATVFNSSALFINRAEIAAGRGRATEVQQSVLPSNISNYLSTTYPNYVFSKALSITRGTTQGYVVIIEANSTRYALEFTAAGTFVRVKPIR